MRSVGRSDRRRRRREGSPPPSTLPAFLAHASKPLPLPPPSTSRRHHHDDQIRQQERSSSRWRRNKRRYDDDNDYNNKSYHSHLPTHHYYYNNYPPVPPIPNHYYTSSKDNERRERRSNPYKRYRRSASASVSSRSDHTSCSSSIDDEVGHYLGRKGDCITRRYEIEKELGKVRRNDYVGLPMEFVRSVSKQLLQALNFLQSIHLVHTDLKLENVLFVSSTLEARTIMIHGERKEIVVPVNPRIKLIDFGGATYENDEERSRIINTRQYRSPEVLLELEWSYPSDIWSAACIIAEVYAGDLLFQTHAQLEHLAMVEKLCGRFPGHMVRESVHKKRYFDSHGRVKRGELSRSSDAFVEELLPLEGKRGFFSVQPEDWQSGIVELMKGLLTIDPCVRLTAQQALNTTFFTRKESC
eukprot:scaffold487_cov178-Ochromonas_danica.AAC.18